MVSPEQQEEQSTSDDDLQSFYSIAKFNSWSPHDLEPRALRPNSFTGKPESETFSFQDATECGTSLAAFVRGLGDIKSEFQVFSLSPEPRTPVVLAKDLSDEAFDMLLQQQIMYIQKHKSSESITAVQNITEKQSEKVMELFFNVDATVHQREKLPAGKMTDKGLDFLLQQKIPSIQRNMAGPRDFSQQQQVVDLKEDHKDLNKSLQKFGVECSDDSGDDRSLSNFHSLARALLSQDHAIRRSSSVPDRMSNWDDMDLKIPAQERTQNRQSHENWVSYGGKHGSFLDSPITAGLNYNTQFPSPVGEGRKRKSLTSGTREKQSSNAKSAPPPFKRARPGT